MTRTLWNYLPANQETADDLHKRLGIHPALCRVLVQRDIISPESVDRFFRPDLKNLHDPFLMTDMDKAVHRLLQAVEGGQKILLYGDYDVDGATAIALMYSFLEKIGVHADYYIPDRYKEGYGISETGLKYARDTGARLIIAMDCGITAVRQAETARSFGIDLIICDHHLPEERLPDAVAVLDPRRTDCHYPYKELSGCGVAFKLAQAYALRSGIGEEVAMGLLDLIAISIAADIVKMDGENRILTHHGLQLLNKGKRPGISALVRESRRNYPLTVGDVVFGLAPRLNAAGRLADAGAAVRLLLAGDKVVAADLAQLLGYRNDLRKELDQQTTEEAKAMFMEMENWSNRKSVVLYQPHWHKGVAGIVASRMVEHFYRPAIILTRAEDKIVGSARSIRDFDLHAALKSCEKLLLNFGGHHHAAGLSLDPADLPAFQDLFEAVADHNIRTDQLAEEIPVSGELALGEINFRFWRELSKFAPFGPGNRQPVFVSRQVRDTGNSALLKGEHLQLSIAQGDGDTVSGIGFGLGAHYERVKSKEPFDLCFTVQEETWQGKSRIRLMVKDLKFES